MGRAWGVLRVCALVGGAVLLPGGAPAAAPAAPGPEPAGLERYVIVPPESQVIYRVGEVFFEEGGRFNVAVGTTNAVQGEVFVDRAHPRRSRVGTITVDISQFRSDSSRRDNAIRARWLESKRYPTAVFTPTALRGMPEVYTPSRDMPVEITGNLTIREVTKPATFAAKLRLDGTVLTGIATTTILMTDFGFVPPAILGVLKAENEVKLEFRFLARHGE
jgi:polyisoprenoid-binding protein YceI